MIAHLGYCEWHWWFSLTRIMGDVTDHTYAGVGGALR